MESIIDHCIEYGCVWVGGMCYVHSEDAATVNAERLANGLSPLECDRCGKSYSEEKVNE